MGTAVYKILDNLIGYIPPEVTERVPNENDDETKGFSTRSHWIMPDAKKIFMCTDASTGAAVWKNIFSDGLTRNNTGSPLTQLHVVRADVPLGSQTTSIYAKADADANYNDLQGVILTTLAHSEAGYTINHANIYRVNSTGSQFGESWGDGQRLWLSAATDGYLTKTMPISPLHNVEMGYVVRAHATQGVVYISTRPGYETHELDDVNNIPADTTGQVLSWNETDKIYSPDDMIIAMKDSGHITWTGTGNYYDPAFPAGNFSLLRGGAGRIHSNLIPFSSGQITAIAANVASWIYIDNTGTLQSTATRSEALFENQIVLFIVLYDGTNYKVVKENHPYKYDTSVSNLQHDIIGTVLEGTGAEITRVTLGTGTLGTDRELKIVGADELEDHGLETDIPDSAGAGVSMEDWYINGSGNWIRYASQTQAVMFYNNTGTPTALGNGKLGVFRVMVSKDNLNSSTPQYFRIMHTAQFNNIAAARTAINLGVAGPTNELFALEMAQLGYIIVENNVSGGYIREVQIAKSVLGTNTIGPGSSNIAALISTDTTNFDGALSAADSNVQNALETIDDSLGAAIRGQATITFNGQGSVLTTGAKKVYLRVPYTGTITAVTLLADQTGSIVIDIWSDTYGNYPPTVADTITAAAKPTITTAIKSTDSTLSGWNTAVTKGNILEFNIDSVVDITKCILALEIDKTEG